MTPQKPSAEVLAPCPFCGKRALLDHEGGFWTACCPREECEVFFHDDNREAVVAAWNRRTPPTGPGEASDPAAGGEVERDISGETVCGFRVAAWRETHPEHGDKFGHSYSEHWSTPSRNPAVQVERLFTEDQLRAALSTPSPPQAPEGWVCVPREPTAAMLDGLARTVLLNDRMGGRTGASGGFEKWRAAKADVIAGIYRAMLAAAPQDPAQ